MKIAVVTEDGKTVSQHFGRASLYMVVAIEDGKVVSRETRDKSGHHTFAAHHADVKSGEPHGYDTGAQVRHASMTDTIADCQVLIAGGMGWGAYDSLKSHNIVPIVTDVEDIDEAVQRYIDGKLANLMERLH